MAGRAPPRSSVRTVAGFCAQARGDVQLPRGQGRRIGRGTHRSVSALERAIKDYLAVYNENTKPFVWTKTADEILERRDPREVA